MNRLIFGFFVLTLVFIGIGHSNGEVTFDWGTVGNPGNAGELSGESAGGYGPDRICGAVDCTYRISKYEVTSSQYVEFLNAVAASDPNKLYNTYMWLDEVGCKIERTGEEGSYSYSVAADRANRPVSYVSFFDAMRFVNWLENGQPTGEQDASTTEDGVYTISDGFSEVRNPNATYFIPSEDEWYKAAYHKNDGVTGNYWDFPTSTDMRPYGFDPGNQANINRKDTTNVGTFVLSDSPYGTYDQGGNVWEWNEAVIYSLYGLCRGLRGGSFDSNIVSLRASTRYDYGLPLIENADVGFRVACIPEPSSMVLLIIFGGIAFARCRMRRSGC